MQLPSSTNTKLYSQCYKEAVLKTITIPASTGNVGKMLPSHLAKQRLEHRKCLLKLLSNSNFQDEALNFVDVMTLAKDFTCVLRAHMICGCHHMSGLPTQSETLPTTMSTASPVH